MCPCFQGWPTVENTGTVKKYTVQSTSSLWLGSAAQAANPPIWGQWLGSFVSGWPVWRVLMPRSSPGFPSGPAGQGLEWRSRRLQQRLSSAGKKKKKSPHECDENVLNSVAHFCFGLLFLRKNTATWVYSFTPQLRKGQEVSQAMVYVYMYIYMYGSTNKHMHTLYVTLGPPICITRLQNTGATHCLMQA